MIAIGVISAILLATGTSYGTYFKARSSSISCSGPPPWPSPFPCTRTGRLVRRKALPLLAALIAGTATSILSAIAVGAALGLPRDVLISLAPKSVTAPVAMSLSEHLGGIPALTAVLVVITGVLGAVVVTPLMNAMGVRDYAARGFAAGLSAHGIGTARAFVVDPVAGTFAGIAMGLSAIVSSLLIPVIVRLLFPTA